MKNNWFVEVFHKGKDVFLNILRADMNSNYTKMTLAQLKHELEQKVQAFNIQHLGLAR